MAKTKVVMNSAGVRELLTSGGTVSLLQEQGGRIAGAAGGGYEATTGTQGKTRARVWVGTDTTEARLDNARNATLLRALGGG